MTMTMPVIDLFAGAGGLGIGAQIALGDLRLSLDSDSYACETLRANGSAHSARVIEADVTGIDGADLRRQAPSTAQSSPWEFFCSS